MSTKEQRGMMAAHATDLAGVMLRSAGDPRRVRSLLSSARWIVDASGEVDNYRECLRLAGLAPADIDASVAAIERGEQPPTSLPARVRSMYLRVEDEMPRAMSLVEHSELKGARNALGTVLAMLGVKS